MLRRDLILVFGMLKKLSKLEASSQSSGSQIIVGMSGYELGKKVPFSLTWLDSTSFAPIAQSAIRVTYERTCAWECSEE